MPESPTHKSGRPTTDLPITLPNQKLNNILVMDYEVKSLMYADQTGLFPAVSSLGNKYPMILHHVDSNSFWMEAMKDQLGGKLILECACALARLQHFLKSGDTVGKLLAGRAFVSVIEQKTEHSGECPR